MSHMATIVAQSAPGKLHLRTPRMDDPWMWLSAGWKDMWQNPVLSIGYGATFVLLGLLATIGLWFAGLESIVPALAAGFILMGPVFAIGLYEMSRKYEVGEKVYLRDIVMVPLPSPAQLGFLAYALMFLFLIWMRLATLNYAAFSYGDYRPISEFIAFMLTSPQGIAMLVTGTAIGGSIALLAFAMSVISVPILLRNDVDVLTAISLSFQVVWRNPGPMLLWAWLIAVLTAIGLATMFMGLAIVFPLVGHATWHAYRSLVVVE